MMPQAVCLALPFPSAVQCGIFLVTSGIVWLFHCLVLCSVAYSLLPQTVCVGLPLPGAVQCGIFLVASGRVCGSFTAWCCAVWYIPCCLSQGVWLLPGAVQCGILDALITNGCLICTGRYSKLCLNPIISHCCYIYIIIM